MKIWNVSVGNQEENNDLGTYGTRQLAVAAANKEMRKSGQTWEKVQESDDQITFWDGNLELIVESIYLLP